MIVHGNGINPRSTLLLRNGGMTKRGTATGTGRGKGTSTGSKSRQGHRSGELQESAKSELLYLVHICEASRVKQICMNLILSAATGTAATTSTTTTSTTTTTTAATTTTATTTTTSTTATTAATATTTATGTTATTASEVIVTDPTELSDREFRSLSVS
eukprot:Lankesteria_metandrocarpae@DN8590_c0_g1_i1.p1